MNLEWMITGVGSMDLVVLMERLLLGAFYFLARFRWVYDPSRPENRWFNRQRHEHLIWKLGSCHYPANRYLAGVVALTEISGGLGVAFGLLTVPAAFGLCLTTLFATCCTATAKILEQNPVDAIDWVSDYLWRVEFLYLVIALNIMLSGPGYFSLDHLIASYSTDWRVSDLVMFAGVGK
jgi:uncharacterized membrane protein YphA (DoxX/SURF4 family)